MCITMLVPADIYSLEVCCSREKFSSMEGHREGGTPLAPPPPLQKVKRKIRTCTSPKACEIAITFIT